MINWCAKKEDEYPNIKLVGATNGYIKDKDSVMEYIKTTKPDIVMLALGIPLQEKLIYKHIKVFKKGIFMGVGGSFDVLSGSKKRAPKIFIKLNLEWLYRIMCEPSRLKRFYDSNIKFMLDVYFKK
jgi:N-acetylglucosaminyldiphosphoundecaprenol N-acetyl-beta-D-mannosaminyltransferase